MRSTRSLSKLCLSQAARALLVTLVLVALGAPALASAPTVWPEGWSREQRVTEGIPHYGHLSAPAGQDGVWIAAVNYRAGRTLIDITLYSLGQQTATATAALAVTHRLRGFTMQESADGLTVIWIERQEGVESTLHRATLNAAGGLVEQDIIWRTAALAESPAFAKDRDGTIFVVLAAAIDGHHAIHLLTVSDAGEVSAAKRLTTPDELATVPTIAVGGGKLHLVFHRHRREFSWAMYHLYELPSLARTVEKELSPVPQDYDHPPTLLANDDGSVTLVWQRMLATAARVMALEPTQGRLLNGQWIEPLRIILPLRGQVLTARGARGDDGRILVVAMVEVGRTWQAQSILRDAAGNTVRAGFATMTRGHALSARPLLVGTTGVVTFFSHDNAGKPQVYLVQTATPARRTLAFRIGLDPHAPVWDAVYRYISLLMGASFLTFGATGAMLISFAAIWLMSWLGLFSATPFGDYLRLALQFGIIALLKQPDSLLYFGAVMLPGWPAVISFGAAALLALAVVRLADLPADDYLTLSFTGLLFVFGDAFTSLFMAGVGRW
jgi:hypothetical protein